MGKPNAQGRKKTKTYTNSEKKLVAEEVEKYPELWKLSDPNYCKSDANFSAWNKVSKKVALPAEECKLVWKKIRDSVRYREKKLKDKVPKKKSGDALQDDLFSSDNDDDTDEEDDGAGWYLSECCRFLKENKLQRTTTSTIGKEKNVEDSTLNPDADNSNEPRLILAGSEDKKDETPKSSKESISANTKASNYDYMRKRKRETSGTDSETSKLISGMTDLVELRKTQMNKDPIQPKFKFESMLANYDRMLSKLPDEIIEDVNFKITNLLYEEIKKATQK